jgi:hypothetical protein
MEMAPEVGLYPQFWLKLFQRDWNFDLTISDPKDTFSVGWLPFRISWDELARIVKAVVSNPI